MFYYHEQIQSYLRINTFLKVDQHSSFSSSSELLFWWWILKILNRVSICMNNLMCAWSHIVDNNSQAHGISKCITAKMQIIATCILVHISCKQVVWSENGHTCWPYADSCTLLRVIWIVLIRNIMWILFCFLFLFYFWTGIVYNLNTAAI